MTVMFSPLSTGRHSQRNDVCIAVLFLGEQREYFCCSLQAVHPRSLIVEGFSVTLCTRVCRILRQKIYAKSRGFMVLTFSFDTKGTMYCNIPKNWYCTFLAIWHCNYLICCRNFRMYVLVQIYRILILAVTKKSSRASLARKNLVLSGLPPSCICYQFPQRRFLPFRFDRRWSKRDGHRHKPPHLSWTRRRGR